MLNSNAWSRGGPNVEESVHVATSKYAAIMRPARSDLTVHGARGYDHFWVQGDTPLAVDVATPRSYERRATAATFSGWLES